MGQKYMSVDTKPTEGAVIIGIGFGDMRLCLGGALSDLATAYCKNKSSAEFSGA